MNKKLLIFVIIAGFFGASCSKYLDINNNPNSVTDASPDLILPSAIVSTAAFISSLNDYGSQTGGYDATGGGYGGFGSLWTYNYSTGDAIVTAPWTNGYSTLQSFQSIVNATTGDDSLNYNAIAMIMKVYIFQNLVDWYNDIPFTQALQGDNNLTPKYDSGYAIYPALALMLDTAINEINTAANNANAVTIASGSDPLFNGNMTSWKQFANSLKLRLIIRALNAPNCNFANTTFSSDGFLTSDAIVNPGYQLATNQVSPSWNTWVGTYTGSRPTDGASWIAATYAFGYYNGTKLNDSARGAAIYYGFPNTPTNQLGYQPPNDTLTAPLPGGDWYSGGGSGTSMGNAIGIMKGPNMGEPLMLLAECDFLQAEADIRGILNQTAATDFNNGILASFQYLYELPSGNIAAGYDPVADANTYIANNSGSYLVNFSLATSTAEQTEAIITQKYIALNMINGAEAWNEYRRTGYPVCAVTATNNPYGSFVSLQSQSTASNKLPARVPYPNSEYTYNAANIPVINMYTSKIFWAK